MTQRELAKRAATAQSVVARIEAGLTSPRWETLARLLDAAGFELTTRLDVRPIVDTHMLDDVARIMALTPEARLAELANMSELTTEARPV